MTAHGSRPSIPPYRGVPCESGFHAVEAHLKSEEYWKNCCRQTSHRDIASRSVRPSTVRRTELNSAATNGFESVSQSSVYFAATRPPSACHWTLLQPSTSHAERARPRGPWGRVPPGGPRLPRRRRGPPDAFELRAFVIILCGSCVSTSYYLVVSHCPARLSGPAGTGPRETTCYRGLYSVLPQ